MERRHDDGLRRVDIYRYTEYGQNVLGGCGPVHYVSVSHRGRYTEAVRKRDVTGEPSLGELTMPCEGREGREGMNGDTPVAGGDAQERGNKRDKKQLHLYGMTVSAQILRTASTG